MKKLVVYALACMVLILSSCGTREETSKVTISPEMTEENTPKETTSPEATEECNTSSSEKAELRLSEDWESFFIGDREIAFERFIDEGYPTSIKYLTDNQIIIEFHVSKDNNELLVYDLDKEEYIADKFGLNFSWFGDDISTLVYVGYKDFDNSDDRAIKNYEEDILYTSSYPLGIRDYAKDGTVTFEEHTVVSDGDDNTWVEHTCVNDKLKKK